MIKTMAKGMVLGGVVCAVAMANMKPRDRRKMMKKGKKALHSMGIMDTLDMF